MPHRRSFQHTLLCVFYIVIHSWPCLAPLARVTLPSASMQTSVFPATSQITPEACVLIDSCQFACACADRVRRSRAPVAPPYLNLCILVLDVVPDNSSPPRNRNGGRQRAGAVRQKLGRQQRPKPRTGRKKVIVRNIFNKSLVRKVRWSQRFSANQKPS